MPILDPLSDEQANSTAKEIFAKVNAKLKVVPNIYRTMGYAPEVLAVTLQLSENLQSGLDPKLRELVYLKTSMINECHY